MTIKESYQHGQFSWVDLVAHDKPAAEEFYAKLFDWTVVQYDTQGGPPYAQFTKDGHGVAGVGQMNDDMKSHGAPPMWNSYINVDRVEEIAAKAEQLGGAVVMPVMKVLEAGHLAFIQDPTGAAVGLWQKNQHYGAELVNAPGAFCWNELMTRDIDAAKEFYGKLFDWRFVEHTGAPTKYFIIKNADADNGGLMLMDEQWGEIPPHWVVYFAVADAEATTAQLGRLGGRVNAPPFDTEVGKIAALADPQGASFNIIQMANPPA